MMSSFGVLPRLFTLRYLLDGGLWCSLEQTVMMTPTDSGDPRLLIECKHTLKGAKQIMMDLWISCTIYWFFQILFQPQWEIIVKLLCWCWLVEISSDFRLNNLGFGKLWPFSPLLLCVSVTNNSTMNGQTFPKRNGMCPGKESPDD